jgi:phosphate transport system substrate-binding protein
MWIPRKTLPIFAVVAALSLLAGSCAGTGSADGGDIGGNSGVQIDPNLTGGITVSGSSTVEPISALVAELFAEQAPKVSINVEGPGTGDGFELFCNGETDISDASRPIEPEEEQACRQSGISYVELEVALDGISVLTSPDNTAVSCLNTADLYALTGPESEGFADWSDADTLGQELGGIGTPYPDAPLDLVGPGEESGTYDAYIELAGIAGFAEDRGLSEDQAETTRPDYQSSPDDNVIIQGVAGSPSSLGWVGYAFYQNNVDTVKAIEISADDRSGCTAPRFESISDGSYPLSRSLYIYVNIDKAAESDALTSFVDYYMSDDGLATSVEESQYVPLSEDRLDATRRAWEEAEPAD